MLADGVAADGAGGAMVDAGGFANGRGVLCGIEAGEVRNGCLGWGIGGGKVLGVPGGCEADFGDDVVVWWRKLVWVGWGAVVGLWLRYF